MHAEVTIMFFVLSLQTANCAGMHQVPREGENNPTFQWRLALATQFGILLLNNPNGTRVSNIEDKHRGDPVQINTEILREWAIY